MTEIWSCTQRLDPWPCQAVAAMLGTATPSTGLLPPLWHWFYFLPTVARDQIGIDGHPRLTIADEAAPPRRMFAAARCSIDSPLYCDQPASLVVSEKSVRETTGRSGPLRIVTYQYLYSQQGRVCIREERDIVYRSGDLQTHAAAPKATQEMPTITPQWQQTMTPDAVMLMRMSALTFNSHRIHYDQHYAQQVEGYPERVVHAPLTAVLLMDLLRQHEQRPVVQLAFRARSPLFINAPIRLLASVDAQQATLHAVSDTGQLAMDIEVGF